jgi:hypothetical protein
MSSFSAETAVMASLATNTREPAGLGRMVKRFCNAALIRWVAYALILFSVSWLTRVVGFSAGK